MTTLDTKDDYVVLINTFTVKPEKAQALVNALAEATETMRLQRGFVSANLHTSHDRTRVVNYAQWRSKDDMEAMLNNPQAQPHMKAAADIADGYEPVLYKLDFVGQA